MTVRSRWEAYKLDSTRLKPRHSEAGVFSVAALWRRSPHDAGREGEGMSRLKLSVVCARVEQSNSKREGKSTSHSEMTSRGEGSIDVDGQWIMAGQVAIAEGKGTNACFLCALRELQRGSTWLTASTSREAVRATYLGPLAEVFGLPNFWSGQIFHIGCLSLQQLVRVVDCRVHTSAPFSVFRCFCQPHSRCLPHYGPSPRSCGRRAFP